MKNGGIEFVPPGLRFMVKMRLSSKPRDVKPICTNLRGSWAFFQSRFPLIKCPDQGGSCLITLLARVLKGQDICRIFTKECVDLVISLKLW